VRAAVVALEKVSEEASLSEGGWLDTDRSSSSSRSRHRHGAVGIRLADGNAHAPNEFIVLENFFGGNQNDAPFL